jgi:nitrite reductase/ring-hydroxylating ferredoxin subunit
MARFVIGTVDEIPPGQRRIVEVNGISIGVFNVQGSYYALRNTCPHQGAPLCLGSVRGTTLPSAPGEYNWGREGEIIRCPWHGWEFDLLTGRSIFNPHRCRVKPYEVTVEAAETTNNNPDVEADPRVCPPDTNNDPGVETYTVTVEPDHERGADTIILHL